MSEYDRKTDPQGFYNIFTVQPWVRFWARVIDTFIIDTIVRITQFFSRAVRSSPYCLL